MSEENTQVVEETIVEDTTQGVENSKDGLLVQENKKYRQRAQTAEAELKELKEKDSLREQEELERNNKFESLNKILKEENERLKPIVENFEIQNKQRREHLLSQLSDEEQNIYEDLSTNKLEKHIERLSNKKVQVTDAKEVTSSGKFAETSKFQELSQADRLKAKKNPKLWQQIVDGYKQQ